jgi:hypothetical protein
MNRYKNDYRKISMLALVGVGLASIPAVVADAAKPPKPPGNNALKLTSAPTIINYGAASVLSGQLTGNANAGLAVALQQDVYPYGDGLRLVASTTTNAQGRFSFTRTPGANTNYRVTVKARTATTGVRVRPRVSLRLSDTTPAAAQLVTFSGKVRPAHDGFRVSVQRQTPTGSFATVRRPLLHAAPGNESTYRTSLRIGSTGTYRVVILSHGDHLFGASAVRVLTAH